MTIIVVVGGADTGRAPMAAALLQRIVEQQALEWAISSAGVLGHDGDPAEAEAREAMLHMGIDISEHRARSITDELAATATLLLAVDRGTTLALRNRFSSGARQIVSLSELSNRDRDIPDPFRMQVGAWIVYAREIDAMLQVALPRIQALLPAPAPAAPAKQPAATSRAAAPPALSVAPSLREAAVERIQRLLLVAADMPEAVNWPAAQARLETELNISAQPDDPTDLVIAYSALLRSALSMSASPPTTGQLAALADAVGHLRSPISPTEVAWLSQQLAGWVAL
jgi:protein-tyrosine-phosphatase